jgi:hypothetical protein
MSSSCSQVMTRKNFLKLFFKLIYILFILGVFYYFNSALNPILYSVMSKRFRRGFSDIRFVIRQSQYQPKIYPLAILDASMKTAKNYSTLWRHLHIFAGPLRHTYTFCPLLHCLCMVRREHSVMTKYVKNVADQTP